MISAPPTLAVSFALTEHFSVCASVVNVKKFVSLLVHVEETYVNLTYVAAVSGFARSAQERTVLPAFHPFGFSKVTLVRPLQPSNA